MHEKKIRLGLLGGIAALITFISFVSACQMDSSLLEEVNNQVKEAQGAIDRELNIAASGSGTVTPGGTVTLQEKDSLDITATPQSGYGFIRWEKVGGGGTVSFGDSTRASTTVNLRGGDASIQAVFTADTYNLTVGNDGNGTTNPSGSVTVDHDTARSISATPSKGYQFSGWTVTSGSATFDDADSASTNVTLIAGDAEIRANFSLITYTLTMTNDGNGSTSPGGQITVDYDTAYTIRAYPNRFYSFAGWVQSGGNGIATFTDANDRYTDVRVTDDDVTVEATFVQSTYDLVEKSQLTLNVLGYLDSVSDMLVDGNYLYMGGRDSNGDGTVMKIDISNKSNPSVVEHKDTGASGNVTGLAISGSYLYAADSSNGLYRFDKDTLGSKIANLHYGVRDVAVHGSDSSFVLGITDYYDRVYAYYSGSSSLSSGDYVELPGNGYHIAAYYNYAFVTASNAGGDGGEFHSIEASNLRDQSSSVFSIIDTHYSAFGGYGEAPGNLVIFEDEVAYMSAMDSLVGIYVDGPTSLSLAEDEPMVDEPFDLDFGYFSDGKTYYKSLLVTASKDGSGKYTFLDIYSTGDPQVLDSFTTATGTDPEAITVDGNYLYTVENGDTIVIYEIVIDP